MAHQLKLEKAKYRQWAKAGLGLGYLKEGLAPFCQDIANQQHIDMLHNIQQTKSLPPNVTCGTCQLRSLKPDHVKAGNKVCPYGQANCNCWFPNGKIVCPNQICGAIYDHILQSHTFTPPTPNWKNTDSQMWTADPWSIAKCYINAPGYDQKTSAADTDCTGLLHVIINNKYFHNHISCNVPAGSIFSKVRNHRNKIFHSSHQELEEATANSYIDDMITVLQDGRELVNHPDAQLAVQKLQDLKSKDLIITSESHEELLKQVREDLMHELNELKTTVPTKEGVEELDRKISNIEELLKQSNDEAESTKELLKQTRDETESTKELLKQTRDETESTKELLKQTRDETESTKELLKQTRDETESTKGLLKQTRDETESTKELLKQTRDETESTKELLKQTRDETESTKGLLKQTRDETESTKELLKQTRDEMVKSTDSTTIIYKRLKRKITTIGTQMSEQKEDLLQTSMMCSLSSPSSYVEMKRLRVEGSPEQKQLQYEKAKTDLRRQMIDRYRETLLQVPVLPLIPRTNKCSFSEIYIRPRITHEVKGEKGETEEKEVNSMSEIFTKNGVPLKSIYVVGDAGTGKSSFCKYLVNCWCMAHCEENQAENIAHKTDIKKSFSYFSKFRFDTDEYDIKEYEKEFNGVKEMKKFDFLFHIALRRYQNVVSIHEMLKNHYNLKILDELLENDSAKIIILLDGLDEWSSVMKTHNQYQTVGLPEQEYLKNYTVVTTSRPWKVHTLGIDDTEIQQMLKLKGFDERCERIMIYRTVSYINSQKGMSKDVYDCFKKLKEKSLRSLKKVPIMLQQLICLWFDGKLDKTSKCAVFTGMLELFFTWNENKTAETSSGSTEGSQTVELPEYIADKEICDSNSHFIHSMSHLAYQTLFNCLKDKSLTFDISVCRKLKIADDVRRGCLKLGILTEESYPSFSVSERPKSMFSFIHKSVQEFLAAVNIAINFITKMSLLNSLEDTDLQIESIKFIKEVFKSCSTVNEILEQSNVIIMLCGLEPRLATHVSKYIYDIVNEDPLVKRYRRTIDSDSRYSDYSCKIDIQNLIFDSMKECNSCPVANRPSFCIGDLYIDDDYNYNENENCHIVCSSFDQQQITPDFIHSIYVDDIYIENVKFSKYLPNFKHLEKINIDYDPLGSISTENVDIRIDEVNKSIVETIKINASSLKSLSLCNDVSLCKEVLCLLPSMINLVAIKMTGMIMSLDDTTRFCEYLEGTSQLEQIHIDIKCECWNQHDVDLSKHQQLQYLNLSDYTCICVTDIDTVNLEMFKYWNIKSTNDIKIFDCFMKCDNLKELDLCVDYDMKSQSFHTSITKRLVSLLPLLHNLSKLVLQDFRLTDNIIQVPSEMKSLKSIDLNDVKMSLTTWRKFVDSLPSIPHTVNVTLSRCYITRDGEEFNVDWSLLLGGVVVAGEKGNEAIQYVKDRKHLFIVRHDDLWSFRFSTRK